MRAGGGSPCLVTIGKLKGMILRVLVTGGAGYIGSITTRMLLDRSHEVIVLDTLENGCREAVDPRADFLQASIGERAIYPHILKGVDAVMHLAGYIEVAESVENPEKYFFNNFENAKVMLDALVEHFVDKVVFSSTAAVYGNPESLPITEQSLLAPINPYGQSKLKFEELLRSYGAYGIESIIFRYFNVAGADIKAGLGENHKPETHIIPLFLKRLMEGEKITIFGNDYATPDGTCIRDYIHVLDLARAHCVALESLYEGKPGGTYNLGNNRGYSNLEVAHAVTEVLGIPDQQREKLIVFGERRAGDPETLIASHDRAYKELGWTPQYQQLSQMISDAHTYYEMVR